MAIYFTNYYYVPDSDFFDIQNTAISFMHFNLPESYQRLPLYSIFMAMLSIILPVKNDLLLAAQLINLIAFIISTVLLFLVSKRLIGKTAFLVTYLYAMHPQTIYLTAQPKAEMLTVMFVLLGIHLSLKTREESYLAAFLASITRYEGSLLIPSLVFRDFMSSKRLFRCLFLGFISSLGLILWLMLNYKATGHINPYYVYFDPTLTPAGVSFFKVMVKTLRGFIDARLINLIPLKTSFIVIIILTTIGPYFLLKHSFENVISIVIFFVACILVNLRFFSPTPEHTFLIMWVFFLFMIAALNYVTLSAFSLIRNSWYFTTYDRYFSDNMIPYILIFLSSLLIMAINIILSNSCLKYAFLYIPIFFLLIYYILITIDFNKYSNMVIVIFLICFLGFFSARNIVAITKRIENSKNIKAELRLVGEWYSKYCIDGKKIAVSEPWVVRYYSDTCDDENIIALGDFKASSYKSFIDELKKKNVQYIVWDSTHGNLEPGEVHYYYYKKYNMDRISSLKDGHDMEHFKLIQKLAIGSRYAYIYEVVL
jgi:hypothetical protein